LCGNGNDSRVGLIWERETRCGCKEEDSLVDNALDGLNDKDDEYKKGRRRKMRGGIRE
jgi:hypothetical protein